MTMTRSITPVSHQRRIVLQWFVTGIVSLILSSSSSSVYAWGTLGHEIVANIAWNRLDASIQEQIISILGHHVKGDEEDAGSPLAEVADWADRVRHYKPWSGALHYIDVRDDLIEGGCHYSVEANGPNDPQCIFDYSRDCPSNICVAGAIVNYTDQLFSAVKQTNANINATLEDLSTSPTPMLRSSASSFSSNKLNDNDVVMKQNAIAVPANNDTREALMFLTHFVGDIHQPLHCSRTSDKGGNDLSVHFNLPESGNLEPSIRNYHDLAPPALSAGKSHHHSWNLHSVWDTAIIEVVMARDYNHSRKVMEESLMQQIQIHPDWEKEYSKCPHAGQNVSCTILWGQESWIQALEFAYQFPNHTTDIVSGSTLTEEYYAMAMPIVEQRLIAGGIRLASTLQNIFGAQKTDKSAAVESSAPNETLPTSFVPSFMERWSKSTLKFMRLGMLGSTTNW